ncbi:MAG: HAD-IC family P-type ATPase [Nitrososphaerota archaeon]|nr:HAD-IC family P-type ATPase [Nitrososphaerota archaeon]MDG6922337.1 HAD-IC family P-type ATPase [Nitrososphaerota archaeon]
MGEQVARPSRVAISKGLSNMLSAKVLIDSVKRLNPVLLVSNPVMLVVELTFFIISALAIYPQGFLPLANTSERSFYVEIAVILLVTVWFSTFSDALAETQARSTANSLRTLESEVVSRKVVSGNKIISTTSSQLRKEDMIRLDADDIVPIDSDVIEGIAMVDESLITGESALVRKAPGDQLIGGSRIASDSLTAKVSVNPEDTYINQMIKLVESARRPRTPNEQAVTVVLIGITAIFTIIIMGLLGLSIALNLGADLSVLIALYVCLLPTTIGALLPAIGLSGISRLYKRKIVAKSGKSIEAAGDTDTILLDKTGTITVGNRQAIEFIPFNDHTEKEVGETAFLSSWYDDTPEGRSIIRLTHERGFIPREINALDQAEVYNFSATTRTSGVKLPSRSSFVLPKDRSEGDAKGRTRFRRKYADEALVEFADYQLRPGAAPSDAIEILKGAPDSIRKIALSLPDNFDDMIDRISIAGETPIAIMKNRTVIGVIRLRDVLKPEIKQKIQDVKTMGIRPVMITGDQPLTAKSIATEVGIDDYISRAKPEDKHDIVLKEQGNSRIVAMIGDGTNDAPALAVADVGLAMNSGTQAAKEAANMVDMESNPAKIIDVVMLGKQLLMTRGAVTAFSISNDVAKYFAIVPVLFATVPQLQAMNILHLGLHSAVLSALIFNAIIIPLLIPLAMRGVSFKPSSTMAVFLKNIVIYGLGGVIVPFIGIKLIDVFLNLVFHM